MNNLLSETVVYTKYAKYIPELKRRETWDEIVDRYIGMLNKKYPELKSEIDKNSYYIKNKLILPSMRALQFAGPAVEKNESRVYNCSYMPMNHYKSFSELMFLLLGGTGVGYSVQRHHVEELPEIQKPIKEAKYVINDSIEGWADAVKQLMKSYFGITKVKPRFDYSDIRPKGARLVTAGGKAPGPGPLRICLVKIDTMLAEMSNGDKLKPIQVHDICCHIADAVLAGGIRRAALISLFSMDDEEMKFAKSGNWWEQNGQRGRANNSAVILRSRVKEEEFDKLYQSSIASFAGEPGVYFTNDPEYGTNPCCEISLRPYTFCNLTEIAANTVTSEDDFQNRARAAAFFGTLQAGFTDFHYLRTIWKKNTEKDALIGVGITGICSNNLEGFDLSKGSQIVKEENARVAKLIGINEAARTTTVKPSGTTSCVLESSSGIHAWHSKYYIRNMQCTVGDDLYNYLKIAAPEVVTHMEREPGLAVVGIPQKADDIGTVRYDENVHGMLARVKKYNIDWVHAGHRTGPNTNNVSATVYYQDNEIEDLRNWMWSNRHSYNGLSILPFDGGTYKNAPFEECDEETYNKAMEYIKNNPIVLKDIVEDDDYTTQAQELACAGDNCAVF